MQWLPLDRVNAWRDPVEITYRLPDAHSRQQIDQRFTQTSVPREGEISPFWRVISFQRSMRINHGLERLIIPGRGGGREDLLWWKWMVQGRCFTQREEEEEEEEAGYNLIPRRMRFGLDFFDIISASTNRLLSQVKLYRIYISAWNGSNDFSFSLSSKYRVLYAFRFIFIIVIIFFLVF